MSGTDLPETQQSFRSSEPAFESGATESVAFTAETRLRDEARDLYQSGDSSLVGGATSSECTGAGMNNFPRNRDGFNYASLGREELTGSIDFNKNPIPGYDRGAQAFGPVRLAQITSEQSKGIVDNSLPGTLPDSLPRPLDRLGVSRENLELARDEIRNLGQNPNSFIPQLMSKVRILAFGEQHDPDNNPQRELVAQIMPDLIREGAKDLKDGAIHLVLEQSSTAQPALDEFMRTGHIDPSRLDRLSRTDSFINILKSARESALSAGIPLRMIASDIPGSEQQRPGFRQESRDEQMAKIVDGALSENPNSKVIFFGGANHLRRTDPESKVPFNTTLASILSPRYSMATVVDQSHNHVAPLGPWESLAALTQDITKPAIISTKQAVNAANLNVDAPSFRPASGIYANWDYVVLFPHAKKK